MKLFMLLSKLATKPKASDQSTTKMPHPEERQNMKEGGSLLRQMTGLAQLPAPDEP